MPLHLESENFMDWNSDKHLITRGYIAALNEVNLNLFKKIKDSFQRSEPVLPLVEFIIERIETVTILIQSDKVWDSEIVLRSAVECLVELMYISCAADDEDQKQRLDEFWEHLWEISLFKQSERAKENIKFFSEDENFRLASAPNVLPAEEENLRAKWSKSKRKTLEQKWSFWEITSGLAKNYKGKQLNEFRRLLHSYRLASHVAHGDETGISIIRERSRRPEDQREVAHNAHCAGSISSCYAYSVLTASAVMDFLKLDKQFLFEQTAELNAVHELSEKYISRLYEDDMYDKYRNKMQL